MSSESTKTSNSKKKQNTKKGGYTKSTSNENVPVTLERDHALGMNPRTILTGLYGPRGERIRHTVHDGALRMPRHAIELIEGVTKQSGIPVKTKYELPGLDSVIRPCIDPNLKKITITDLRAVRKPIPQTPQEAISAAENATSESMKQDTTSSSAVVESIVTLSQNRTINRSVINFDDTTSRIRGGGNDGTNPDGSINPSQSTTNPAHLVIGTAAHSSVPVQGTVPVQRPTVVHQPSAVSSVGIHPGQQPQATLRRPPSIPSTAQVPSVKPIQQTTQAPFAPPASRPYTTSAPQHPSLTSKPGMVVGNPRPVHTQSTMPMATSRVPQIQTQVTAKLPPANMKLPTAVKSSEPNRVPSSVPIKKDTVPRLDTLKKRPAAYWEQHKPGPNDEMVSAVDQATPKPSWYSRDKVADVERTMLPEWFNSSAPHRTPARYIEAREKMIHMSNQLANRNLTNALVRRAIVGDAGSLQRLRGFLVSWGFINEDGINDSAPTPEVMRGDSSTRKRVRTDLRDDLINAVVQHSKRQKVEDTDTENKSDFSPVDWDSVALQVGHGMTSVECKREFLTMSLKESSATVSEGSVTPITSNDVKRSSNINRDNDTGPDMELLRQNVFLDLVKESSPEVISEVTDAAMRATSNNLEKAQKAALLGLVVSRGVEHARAQEDALSSVLSEVVSQRMQKLENRMALMDDIEGMLEAERVALELERRDLYTTRCRHWFRGS